MKNFVDVEKARVSRYLKQNLLIQIERDQSINKNHSFPFDMYFAADYFFPFFPFAPPAALAAPLETVSTSSTSLTRGRR